MLDDMKKGGQGGRRECLSAGKEEDFALLPLSFSLKKKERDDGPRVKEQRGKRCQNTLDSAEEEETEEENRTCKK